MLGRRFAVAAVVALFAVTVRAQTTGGSSCPPGNFLLNITQSGKNYTMTMPHATIADGMTINKPCSNASFMRASMVDGSGSGQKGYNLTCTNGTVLVSGFNCQPSSSVSGSSSASLAGGGTTSGGIGPVCDEENWPNKDHNLVCGDCKVLVDSFDSYYKTCDGYCQSMGMACAGAWEESSDSCVVQENMTCGQALQSSDAICECKSGTGVVVKPPCSGDKDTNWTTQEAAIGLTSCAANATLCQDDAPVVALGAPKGWFAKSCCATCGQKSATSATATTSVTGKLDVTVSDTAAILSNASAKAAFEKAMAAQMATVAGVEAKDSTVTVSGSGGVLSVSYIIKVPSSASSTAVTAVQAVPPTEFKNKVTTALATAEVSGVTATEVTIAVAAAEKAPDSNNAAVDFAFQPYRVQVMSWLVLGSVFLSCH